MKCNICGAELDGGERICKYCGNELVSQDLQEFTEINQSKEIEENIKTSSEVEKASEDAERRVYVPKSEKQSRYCTKCGRPLDGITNKCVVCEAAEVGRSGYRNNVPEETPEEYDMAGSRNRKRKKKQNKTAVFLIMVVVMIVLFSASFLIFFNLLGGTWGSEEATPTPQSTEEIVATALPVRTPEVVTDEGTETYSEKPEKPSVTEPPQDEPEDVISYYGGEYLFPSYEKVISDSELESMERQEIKLILQEIYARYGYTFEDDDLVEYFESQSWYMPTTTDIDEVEDKFNKYEKQNVEKIEAYQREMGWRI